MAGLPPAVLTASFRAPMRFFHAGEEHEAEQWLSTRPPTATDPRLRPPD